MDDTLRGNAVGFTLCPTICRSHTGALCLGDENMLRSTATETPLGMGMSRQASSRQECVGEATASPTPMQSSTILVCPILQTLVHLRLEVGVIALALQEILDELYITHMVCKFERGHAICKNLSPRAASYSTVICATPQSFSCSGWTKVTLLACK